MDDDTSQDGEAKEPAIEDIAERPLECTECKKPVAVWYTEIVGETTTEICMCKDCPELQRRLHGFSSTPGQGAAITEGAGLCCGNCGTTLDAFSKGHPLGCSHCYEVFADIIIKELIVSRRVSHKFAVNGKARPSHIGRSLGETDKLSPSLKLIALNEALQETLSREDYEQAAWLRDQIKELTEDGDGKK